MGDWEVIELDGHGGGDVEFPGATLGACSQDCPGRRSAPRADEHSTTPFKLPLASGTHPLRSIGLWYRPLPCLLRFALSVSLLCTVVAPVRAAQAVVAGDAWGVRVIGEGAGRKLESLSEVNTGKPARVQPLQARVVAERGRGGISVALLADAATAAQLQAAAPRFDPELDKAMEWLQRLRPKTQPRARIVLTLVDPSRHTRARRIHGNDEGTVVDLVVPLPVVEVDARPVEVGKALAIALHEASHAFAAQATPGQALSRRDDEYRASLVEACYRVDTLRMGDTLRLAPRPAAGAGEYFVTAQSRDAARDVVAELVRAAGSDHVRGDDNVAMLGLDLACAVRLAQR